MLRSLVGSEMCIRDRLLTDIMENFRETSLKIYKLDPVWYYTTPGFAWDCMLKTTKQKLELLTDVDMLLMFERAKRGGISQCSNRYAKANNKYMGKKFDKNKDSIFIQYLDANNLYGWAMLFSLQLHPRWTLPPYPKSRTLPKNRNGPSLSIQLYQNPGMDFLSSQKWKKDRRALDTSISTICQTISKKSKADGNNLLLGIRKVIINFCTSDANTH